MIKKFLLLSLLVVSGCSQPSGGLDHDWSSGMYQVCIKGHVYYHGSVGAYGHVMAIRLNDEGKPVKCNKLYLEMEYEN